MKYYFPGMKIKDFERIQARITAEVIREIAANAQSPDKLNDYSEAEFNACLASLTLVAEGCMARANA